MSTEPPVVRWYRHILRLYPSALRHRYGDEMVEVVRRRWQEVRGASRIRRAVFALQTWSDALVHAGAAWLERGLRTLKGRTGGPGRSSESEARPRLFGGPDGSFSAVDAGRELGRAARSLARSPGFTFTAVLTLALGIGANTGIFSVVEAVLLEPLPFPESGRLVTISEEERAWTWTPTEIVLELRESAAGPEGFAGLYPRKATVTGDGVAVEVDAARVTPSFFRVLGADVARGRGFTADDARPGSEPTAILGPGLWQRRYGADPGALGRKIRVDGTERRIVGILERDVPRLTPRSGAPEIWTPGELEPTAADGTFRWTQPVIRLAEGRSLEEARSALNVVVRRFQERHANMEGWPQADRRLTPLKSTLVREARPALLVLQLAVGVLLLLACVNVANLLLVRTRARRRELALRSAMGASRGRLVRHLLSESLVLSLVGGAAAVALVVVGLDVVTSLAPADLPGVDAVSVDASVLLFTLGVSVGTGVLFGVVPAILALRGQPGELLRGGGRATTGSQRGGRMSQGMVVAQITLALVLLVAAGAMTRSFVSLTGQEPGFRAEGVLAIPLHVSADRYDTVPELEAFQRSVRERVQSVPGVELAAVGSYMPIHQGTASRSIVVEGRSDPEPISVQYGVVSPDYFRTLGIPLHQGRTFREDDRRGEPRVAVVNRALRDRYWPDRNPVGGRIRFQDGRAWWTVVGVVGDVRGDGFAREPAPGFYVSYQQRPADPVELVVGRRSSVLFVRAHSGGEALAAPVRRAVREVEPRQPVPEVLSLERVVAGTVAPERFRTVLLAIFAVVALLLVVAGVYGVVAHLVGERTREFGVRVAVGATGGDIVGRVLGWGIRLTAVGMVLGLAGILVLNRYLSDLLFQVRPTDPLIVGASATLVMVVTLAACLVPARRALSVDPVDALRPERAGAPDAAG